LGVVISLIDQLHEARHSCAPWPRHWQQSRGTPVARRWAGDRHPGPLDSSGLPRVGLGTSSIACDVSDDGRSCRPRGWS
jgi:hypothetical protein